MDFIFNGQASGSVAQTLMDNDFDPNSLRPYKGNDGRSYITRVNNQGVAEAVPTINATASLRKDDWKILDTAVVKAAKPRLKAVGDLRSAGLQMVIPNGMGKTVLETETQSDITAATISMDGMRESNTDRPLFELTNLPLPIIHKDFQFSLRQIMTSRNGGSPLDTTTAELAGRRVAEEAEKLLLGVSGSYAYGGGTIYGYTNLLGRLAQVLTDPTDSAWTGLTLLTEVLEMRASSQGDYHYGPWVLYTSPDWDIYLDQDYSTAKGDNTVRDRIKSVEGIQDVRTLDYLEDYDMVLVQMTSDVARMVIGMEMNTLQWESKGGLQLNFKVMAIMVPQLRLDQNSNTGIVHGAVADAD